MSNAAINPADLPAATPAPDPHAGNHHDPHLAHHFDTPEQQYISAKLGMWIFLGTEILMFGGLFCAYAVYRHNHQSMFEFAHQYLDKMLGALNTLVLITSSLTMAWAVRSSQLGHQKSLRWLMAVTILGGYIFLGVKSVEYHTKWQHYLFIGTHNQFRAGYAGEAHIANEEKEVQEREIAHEKAAPPAPVAKFADSVSLMPPDPNTGTADQAKIVPPFVEPVGLARPIQAEPSKEVLLSSLPSAEQRQIYTFFAVYFVMTGLHGLHVVIGMSLIVWVLLRALGPKNAAWAVPLIPGSVGLFLAIVGIIVGGGAEKPLVITGLSIAVLCVLWAMAWVPLRRNRSGESEFGPTYFTPVDLVGLYWHLVDLIWIFLFPMLYLIH